jgi:hypothetical protein
MGTRSPEDVLAGVLRIAVGRDAKEPRLVPTLPIAANREWQASLSSGPAAFNVAVEQDDWTAAMVAEFTGLSIDALLDAVVSYDRTGALGGREWLEANADPAQLYAALTQMAEVAFPFATNVPMLLAAFVLRRVVGSDPASSTNGHSPSGGSTRGRSKTGSTQRS